MCKYCENLNNSEIMRGKAFDILGYKFYTGVYINESTNKLTVEFGEEEIFSKKINFCPMCGRKIK